MAISKYLNVCVLPAVLGADITDGGSEYLVPLYPETDYAVEAHQRPYSYDLPRVVAVYKRREYMGVRVTPPAAQTFQSDQLIAALSACREMLAELHPELHPTETTRDAAIWQVCERADYALRMAKDGATPEDYDGAFLGQYLGDGLYVEWENCQITLKANNPFHPTDTVTIEWPAVWESLLRFVARVTEQGGDNAND